MDRLEAENKINLYLKSWLEQDIQLFSSLLDEEVEIKESHGPSYSGHHACLRWFEEWNETGKVLSWKADDFFWDEDAQALAFEWDFYCVYEGNQDGFKGSSFICFKEEKIVSINEYQTANKRRYPYNGNEESLI